MQDILDDDNNVNGHINSKEVKELFNIVNNIRLKTIKNEWSNSIIFIDSTDESIVDSRINWGNKIIYTLLNIIKSNGYILYYNDYQLINHFMDYWFNISLAVDKGKDYISSNVIYKNWIDEYDRYNYKLDCSYWEHFMDSWKGDNIFDDSDIGYKTRIHFPWFVFLQLDLVKSPCIIKFRNEEKEIEEEMRKNYEEQSGYSNVNTNDYSDINE